MISIGLFSVFCNLCSELGETTTIKDVLSGRATHANAPFSTQLNVVQLAEIYQRILVKGGNKLGKSHLIPRLANACLFEEPGNIVVVASVKEDSLKALWGGIKTTYLKLGGFSRNINYYNLMPDQNYPRWYMTGLTTRPNQEEAFAGHHAETGKTYIILDEASGIHASVWAGLEGMLANENCTVIAFGNPLSINCEFFTAYDSGEWHTVTFNALKHPNYRHKRQIYRGAISPPWPDKRIAVWGPRDARTQARVYGDFPDRADNSIIPLSDIRECVGIVPVGTMGVDAAGVDVARFGKNASQAYSIVDGYMEEEFEVYGDRATGKGNARDIAKRIGTLTEIAMVAAVDEDGIGGPVMDFVDVAHGSRMIRYNAGSDSLTERARKRREKLVGNTRHGAKVKTKPKKYYDLASEQWWLFANSIREKRVSLPDDSQLHRQLGDRLYTMPNGTIRLESKDEYMKRTLQPSPDKADAAVIAHFAWLQANKSASRGSVKPRSGGGVVVPMAY